jgi:hypothetical protein
MVKQPTASMIPFVEARNSGPRQKPTAIVLNLSSTTSDKGAALGIANYHHKPNAPSVSHHYILDESEMYQCVWDNVMAHDNPRHSLSVLICAQPHEYVPLINQGNLSQVMQRASHLIVYLTHKHKIQVRYLDEAAEKKWTRHRWRRNGGLIVRAVGTWPYESFLTNVKIQFERKYND